MRNISVSTDVFSLIWAARLPGEETESDILKRVLSKKISEIEEAKAVTIAPTKVSDTEGAPPAHLRDAYWWEVLAFVLEQSGQMSLSSIYKKTAALCTALGRHMPTNLEATLRGTLEDNSSDSERYKNVRDIFCMPEGKHSGVWALRPTILPS